MAEDKSEQNNYRPGAFAQFTVLQMLEIERNNNYGGEIAWAMCTHFNPYVLQGIWSDPLRLDSDRKMWCEKVTTVWIHLEFASYYN